MYNRCLATVHYSSKMYILWFSVFAISKIVAQEDPEVSLGYCNIDLALCTCDLTPNSCDVNCCCDTECNEEDKLVFTHCENVLHSDDRRLCIQPDQLFLNSSGLKSQISQDGLLCIYRDNYQERYNYIEPEPVKTEEDFLAIKNKYGNLLLEERYSLLQEGERNVSVNDNYRVGDPVLMITENVVLTPLTLPSSLFSGFCGGLSAVEIFENRDHICKFVLENITELCETEPQLSAKFYFDGLQVLKSPYSLNILLESVPIDVALAILNSNENFVPFDVQIQHFSSKEEHKTGSLEIQNIPKPSWNAGTKTCQNVVTQVIYHFRMNATAGIVLAKADIGLHSIQSNTTKVAFDQKFSVQFKWATDKPQVLRLSGNPGYRVGEPVMAGTTYEVRYDETSEQVVLVDPDNNKWLTVIGSNDCNEHDKRAPILFGNNMQSGCLIELGMDTSDGLCRNIQESIFKALTGPPRTQVAAYANATVNIGDWVNILIENPPQNEARSPGPGSCSLIVGLEIEIIFAHANSLSNPQAKIVGVVYRYKPQQDLMLQCVGPYCTEGGRSLKQKFPVITTVTFLDVSLPAEPQLAVIPTIDVKLPYDFFYPFTGRASPCSLSLCLLYLCLALTVQNVYSVLCKIS